jgi:hypothetical protein
MDRITPKPTKVARRNLQPEPRPRTNKGTK